MGSQVENILNNPEAQKITLSDRTYVGRYPQFKWMEKGAGRPGWYKIAKGIPFVCVKCRYKRHTNRTPVK